MPIEEIIEKSAKCLDCRRKQAREYARSHKEEIQKKKNPEQQKLCFHYTNLQPLWAKDNLSKGGRVI